MPSRCFSCKDQGIDVSWHGSAGADSFPRGQQPDNWPWERAAVLKGLPWVIFQYQRFDGSCFSGRLTGQQRQQSSVLRWDTRPQGAAAIPRCPSVPRTSRRGSAGLCPLSPCRWRRCRGGCRGKPRARPASGTAPAPTARCRWPPATGRCSGSAGTRSTAWMKSSHTPPRSPCGCCWGGRWPMAGGPGRKGHEWGHGRESWGASGKQAGWWWQGQISARACFSLHGWGWPSPLGMISFDNLAWQWPSLQGLMLSDPLSWGWPFLNSPTQGQISSVPLPWGWPAWFSPQGLSLFNPLPWKWHSPSLYRGTNLSPDIRQAHPRM